MAKKNKLAAADAGASVIESRESFLPQAQTLPPPEVVKAEAKPPPEQAGEKPESVTLIIEKTDQRNIRLTLTIPPLRPCVENRILPVQPISAEMTASIIGGMLARAAASASKDGELQHYRNEQEEAEAKERYGKR